MKWVKDGDYSQTSGAYRVTKFCTGGPWRYRVYHKGELLTEKESGAEAKKAAEEHDGH